MEIWLNLVLSHLQSRFSHDTGAAASVGGRTYPISIAVLPGTTGRQNLLPPPGKQQSASGLKINALKKKQIFPEHFPVEFSRPECSQYRDVRKLDL